MKKIVLAMMLVLTSFSVQAQGQAQGQRREFNPEQSATRQADRIKEACKVDDAQYKKLHDLFLEEANKQKAQMEAMRQQGQQGQRGSFDREAWQKRQEEQLAKIKAILTPEQYAAYEEAMKQMRERRRQGGQQGGRRQGGQQ